MHMKWDYFQVNIKFIPKIHLLNGREHFFINKHITKQQTNYKINSHWVDITHFKCLTLFMILFKILNKCIKEITTFYSCKLLSLFDFQVVWIKKMFSDLINKFVWFNSANTSHHNLPKEYFTCNSSSNKHFPIYEKTKY